MAFWLLYQNQYHCLVKMLPSSALKWTTAVIIIDNMCKDDVEQNVTLIILHLDWSRLQKINQSLQKSCQLVKTGHITVCLFYALLPRIHDSERGWKVTVIHYFSSFAVSSLSLTFVSANTSFHLISMPSHNFLSFSCSIHLKAVVSCATPCDWWAEPLIITKSGFYT